MSRWFRHYAGMMRDEKLVRAALASKQSVERVLWVWGAILESAAESDDEGQYELDVAEVAYFLRTDEADIRAIVAGLEGIGRLSENRVVKWSYRQFKSDRSAERQKTYRDRQNSTVKIGREGKHNSGDGQVTAASRHDDAPDTDTDTEAEKERKETDKPNKLKDCTNAKRVRTPYSEDFENQFWKPYPRTPIMSKSDADRQWKRLSPDDRLKAAAAVPLYANWLKTQKDCPVVHACRFLSQRRFDGFHATPPPHDGAKFAPPPGMPSLDEIRAKYRNTTNEDQSAQVRTDSPLGQNGADHR